MQRYETVLNIESAEGKRHYSDVLLPVVRALDDAVEKDHYLNVIAQTIGVSKAALEQKSQSLSSVTPPKQRRSLPKPQQLDKQTVEDSKLQDRFMSLTLMQPPLRTYLTLIEPAMLYSQAASQLLVFLKAHPDFKGKPEEVQEMQKFAEYAKIIALQYEELYQGLELTELRYEAARLQVRLIEKFVKNQKQTLSSQLETATDTAMETLLLQVRKLDELLKLTTGDTHGSKG